MGNKNSRIRIFSIRRILLSFVLGFLVPLSYAFILSLASDYMGKPIPAAMVYPFGWPRPLWIFLMGRQPAKADIMFGLLFVALCNIALYGSLIYVTLSALQLARHKSADAGLPPPPHRSPQI